MKYTLAPAISFDEEKVIMVMIFPRYSWRRKPREASDSSGTGFAAKY